MPFSTLQNLTRNQCIEKGGTLKQMIETPLNTRIAVDDLDQYIDDAYNIETEGFKTEFQAIPKSFGLSMAYSKQDILKSKNWYKNICPYDDNRVVLLKREDPYSDYINASLIKGPFADLAIIATQGPLKETVDDFWRMISEQNVNVIVMLTQIVENDNIKCYKYWPDEDSRIYGELVVTKLSEMIWKNYCKRTFALSGNLRNSGQVLEEIIQWQYLSWPDHGVPDDGTTFLEFLGKVRKSRSGGGKMAVHCSAGVGRTGTLVAIEGLLSEAARDGSVDVAACVSNLRHQRPFMVQSLKQYQFIYAVLKKSNFWVDSCISLKDYPSEYLRRSSKDFLSCNLIQEEFKKLIKHMPSDEEDIFLSDSYLLRPHKRIFKVTKLHGYNSMSQYIVGNYPEDWNVERFWEVILEDDCLVLLIDQDGDIHAKFLPGVMHALHLHNLYISLEKVENYQFCAMLRINVNNRCSVAEHVYENVESVTMERGENRKCVVMQASTPTNLCLTWQFFTDVREHIRTEGLKDKVLFVAGKPNCPLPGFYVACSILLEQMSEHCEVDIFKTLLQLRKAGIAREFTTMQYEEMYKLIECEVHQRMNCVAPLRQEISSSSRRWQEFQHS